MFITTQEYNELQRRAAPVWQWWFLLVLAVFTGCLAALLVFVAMISHV